MCCYELGKLEWAQLTNIFCGLNEFHSNHRLYIFTLHWRNWIMAFFFSFLGDGKRWKTIFCRKARVQNKIRKIKSLRSKMIKWKSIRAICVTIYPFYYITREIRHTVSTSLTLLSRLSKKERIIERRFRRGEPVREDL